MLLAAEGMSPFDAFKLMNLIYSTAHKAKVHRETCTEFASYLKVINSLLAPLQKSQQVLDHPAVQEALTLLHRALVKALVLIQKCEGTSTLTALMKHVPRQLKELEGEIQKILSLLNLANLHLNLNTTTNGSSAEVGEAALCHYPNVHSPAIGESHSLQESPAFRDALSAKSLSFPSVSGQGLATSQSLSAKCLSIIWGNDERYWKWVARKGARQSEVAYLVKISRLEVRGQMNTSTLSPGKYTLKWRLQVACLDGNEKPSGWDSEPVLFEFSTSDGCQQVAKSTFLVSIGATSSTSNDQDRRTTDGWMEYYVGTFTVHRAPSPVELTFSMKEVNGSWKSGLFLDSVIVAPAGASSSARGIEDSSDLPAIISFSGHPHELKLMVDPYWFACAECEATTHSVGYRCHQCLYSVHPGCCASDYHFSTLLGLSDSQPSHWDWGPLLQLHKHRMEDKNSRPKSVMFAGHHHLLRLTLNPHPSFICDAVNCDGNGWVYKGWDGWIYQCQECQFDVHTDCRF